MVAGRRAARVRGGARLRRQIGGWRGSSLSRRKRPSPRGFQAGDADRLAALVAGWTAHQLHPGADERPRIDRWRCAERAGGWGGRLLAGGASRPDCHAESGQLAVVDLLACVGQDSLHRGYSGRVAVGSMDPATGKSETLWRGDESIGAGETFPVLSVSADGTRCAVIRSSWTQPPEVWTGAPGRGSSARTSMTGSRPRGAAAKASSGRATGGPCRVAPVSEGF
jgi:hypothetical protein